MKPKNRKYIKSLWQEETVIYSCYGKPYLKTTVLTNTITGEVK